MSNCKAKQTKQREYEININEIRSMDTKNNIYKIIVVGLNVAILWGYFYQGQQDKTGLYIVVVLIFSICLFYIAIYMLPKLDKDNYDNEISLYRRELGQDADFFDLSVDEMIIQATGK